MQVFEICEGVTLAAAHASLTALCSAIADAGVVDPHEITATREPAPEYGGLVAENTCGFTATAVYTEEEGHSVVLA